MKSLFANKPIALTQPDTLLFSIRHQPFTHPVVKPAVGRITHRFGLGGRVNVDAFKFRLFYRTGFEQLALGIRVESFGFIFARFLIIMFDFLANNNTLFSP